MATEKPTKEFSAMLYALADEIRQEEGCVTEDAEQVEAAAERLDTLTVTIRGLETQRARLLDVMDSAARTLDRDGDEWGIAADLRAAIAEVEAHHVA